MSLSYAVRPAWDALPEAVRTAIEAKAGARVVAATSVTGGFTPGVAAVLRFDSRPDLFVKAAGPEHPRIVEMLLAERASNEALTATVPAPALLWSLSADKGWVILAFETANGRHPDLSPASQDTWALTHILERLSAIPCPAALPDAPPRFTGWRDSGAWPEHAEELAAWEQQCSMAGQALVHADLRADNMLISDGRILVVDWAAAVRGAPWVDTAFVCAQLIVAGHAPNEAEQVVSGLTAWKKAAPEEITAFVIGLCGIWEASKAREQPAALREYRSRAALAGRAWISHRLGWP